MREKDEDYNEIIKESVGIVVPVFNNGIYINRCIRSLLKQNVRGYKILLVDDGSTDGSEKICDWYAEKYKNISVLHKVNGGLSSARNEGVKNLDVEYITFVDSDDYVSDTYIHDLICGLKTADMSIVRIKSVGDGIQEPKVSMTKLKINKYDAETAIKYMCYRKYFGFSACGKLFKRSVLLKHPFPIGKLHEDMFTVYKLIDECGVVGYVGIDDYFYAQHKGEGITRTRFDEKHMDAVDAAKEIRDYISQQYPDCINAGYASETYAYWLVTKTLTNSDPKSKEIYKKIGKSLRTCLFDYKVIFDPNLTIKAKLQFVICSAGFVPMNLFWKFYYRMMQVRRA